MSGSLLDKTAKGVYWSAIEHFSVKGIQFIVSLVLARLLLPSDYGLIGLLGIFTSISSVFIDGGVTDALIRRQNRTEEDFTTMFYFNIAMSAVLYIILFSIAPVVANFFGYGELCPIMRVVCLGLVINAFAQVQHIHYTIALDFKSLAKVTVVANIVSGVTGITLAFNGFGVWALVWQGIVYATLKTVILIFRVHWMPTARFSMESLKSMFGFGSRLAVVSILHIIYVDLSNLLIGKVYSPNSLGLYSRAKHFASFSNSIVGIIEKVAYPTLSKIVNDEQRLNSVFHRYLSTSTFIVFPIMFTLAAVASPLINILIGEKWAYSATLMPILCMSFMWWSASFVILAMIKVYGHSDVILRMDIIKKIVGISALLIAIPIGIMAICISLVISSIFNLILESIYLKKITAINYRSIARDIVPSLLLSVLAYIVAIYVGRIFTNDYIHLTVSVFAALASYILVSLMLKRKELTDVITIIKHVTAHER